MRPVGFLIVELNGSFLRRVYLPELADRHFGQLDFEVAVRSAKAPYEAWYLSRADFPIATTAVDAEVNLLDSVAEEARRRGHPTVQTFKSRSASGSWWRRTLRDLWKLLWAHGGEETLRSALACYQFWPAAWF